VSLKELVLAEVKAHPGGLTSEEIFINIRDSGVLDLKHSTVVCRISELLSGGHITRSVEKRLNTGNRKCSVYVLSDPEQNNGEQGSGNNRSTKSFWSDIRRRVLKYASENKRDISSGDLQMFYREFEADMRECASRFAKQVGRARIVEVSPVAHGDVCAACDVLNITRPESNNLVDVIAAKSSFRKMVRTYHPDVHGIVHNESTRAMYETAVEAYDVVVLYNQYVKENGGSRDESKAC
jgi:hypothetical protein